ncbi:MAG: T9SS type A sorting domain-containing protein, partial [Planctomycetes bacterium]|nr:T9SS type A sorting domain-containing protein [Planctomycetota bacterium]
VKAPVIIDGPFFNVLDTSEVKISWMTDEAATSVARYSEGDSLTDTYAEVSILDPVVAWHEILLQNLSPNTEYTFIVLSTDEKDNGPVSSWPITFKTLSVPDFDPPEFDLLPQVIGIDTNRAVIEFETNELANTEIYYNIDSLYDKNIFLFYEDEVLVEYHNVTLSNLIPNTRYRFHVETYDGKHNGPTRSAMTEFKTPDRPDTTPPKFIGFPSTIDKDTSYVKLQWFTDEISTSIVEYGLYGDFESTMVRFENSNLVQEHIVTITGLLTNTKYEYKIGSADQNGYEAIHPNTFIFETAEVVDIIPPDFRRFPYVFARDTNKVTINWETNEPATSILEIAVDSLFDSVSSRTVITDFALEKDHSVTAYGLFPDTRYLYRAGSVDGKNNGPTYSGIHEFNTLEKPDLLPPVILGFPNATVYDTTSVKITWETNEPSNSKILYYPKLDSTDTNTFEDQNFVVFHDILLGGLTPDTEYKFAVYSKDEKGNGPTFKGYYEFKTPAKPDITPPSFKEFPKIVSVDTSSFTIGWETDEEASSWLEYFNLTDANSTDTTLIDDQGLVTLHEITSDVLPSDTEFSVRVYSYDGKGNGPAYSGWFTVRTKDVPDLSAPYVQGFISVVDIDTSSANVKVSTNEESFIEIEYGLSSDWPDNKTPMTPTFSAIDHFVTLTNLIPDTSYTIRMRFTDRVNNVSEFTDEHFFSTLSIPDSLPPVLVGLVDVTKIDTSKATVQWNTNERATSIIEIAPTSTWPDSGFKINDQNLVEFHDIIVKDLKSNTDYTIRVGFMDDKGNGPAYSGELTFKTLAAPDLVPPVIVGIPSERDIDTSSVKIIWGTNEPANSTLLIREEQDSTRAFNFIDGALVTEHSVSAEGLTPDTEYEYRVSSVDANNNGPTESLWLTFRTLNLPDLTPPNVNFGPIVIGRTHHSAVIKFKTDENSFALVSYGTDTTLGLSKYGVGGMTTHNINLSDLSDSTLYYFQIEGKDSKGNEFVFPPVGQERLSFTTKTHPVKIDSSKPIIVAGPVEMDINSDRFTLFWKTDVFTNSVVEYWLDTSQTSVISKDNTVPVLEHRIQITDLLADTVYFYKLKSRGANNQELISDVFFVNTAAEPDTFPPVITGRQYLPFLEDRRATIEWNTDKNTSSIVEFGFDTLNLIYREKADEIVGVNLHQIKLNDLEPDSMYYYIVSSVAYNGRSVISDIDSFKTLASPDTLPPIILGGPGPTSIEDQSVTIEWDTDELSTSKIEYGQRRGAGSAVFYDNTIWVDADAAGVFHHKAVLTGLEPGEEYNYRISSTDLAPKLNEYVGRKMDFTTIAIRDTIAPVLTAGPMVDRTDKVGIVDWDTDEASDSFVYIKEKHDPDANFRKIGDYEKVTKHIVTITNLKKGTEYDFEIASRDFAGNLMTWPTGAVNNSILKTLALRKATQIPGGAGSFFTNQDPDTQKPVIIEGPTVISKTTETLTIQWETDERGDSFVEFGLSSSYGTSMGDATYVTEHKVTLTNLTAASTYNFLVKSTDASGNGPASSANSVVSTESEADQTPPKITDGPVAQSITDDQATIIWETDELSDTYVDFGSSQNLGTVRISTEDVSVHKMVLTNLLPSTAYYYKVQSSDIEDNGPTSSATVSFTTASAPDETPPVITSVTVAALTDKTATITYSTNELGDSFVNYGADANYGEVIGSSTDVTSHSITLTKLDANTAYHYTVGSIDKSDNETIYGADMTFTTEAAPDIIAPDVPANLDGVEGNSQALIWWDRNTEGDLAGYNIYRKKGSGGGEFQLIETLVADTFYYDGSVLNDAVYWYKITAADKVVPYNESDESSPLSINPTAPLAVPAPVPSFPSEAQRIRYDEISMVIHNVTLPPARTEVSYEFVIAEESDFFNQVASITGVAEGEPHTTWNSGATLNHDQTYYWKVRAYDGYFYSLWSAGQSFIADSTMATSVELVEFLGESVEGMVELSWETAKETDNAGFNIYRSYTEDGDYRPVNEKLIDPRSDGDYSVTDAGVDVGVRYFYKLETVSTTGFLRQYDAIAVRVQAPERFELHQNYPNPFNPVTSIKYEIPKPGKVLIKIYNVLGQEVRTLVNEDRPAGFHSVRWNGTNNFGTRVASGMYIYRIIYGNNVLSKKMVFIK